MQRSIGESVDRLFEAYGTANAGKRAVIYREKLRGYSADQVDRSVERLLGSWNRTTAPPVAVLVAACHDVAEEDRRRQRDATAIRERGTRMNPRELEHCRMMAALFDAGFDFDDVLRKWVSADECAHISSTDPAYKPVTFEATQAAFNALQDGRLTGGSERIKRARKRSRIGSVISQETRVTPEQIACFD